MKTTHDLIQHYPLRTKFTTLSNVYIVRLSNGQLNRTQTSCYYNFDNLFSRYQKLDYLLGLRLRRGL